MPNEFERRTGVSPEKRVALRMMEAGTPARAIAQTLNQPLRTVRRWAKEAGLAVGQG